MTATAPAWMAEGAGSLRWVVAAGDLVIDGASTVPSGTRGAVANVPSPSRCLWVRFECLRTPIMVLEHEVVPLGGAWPR